jgi:hypothetical protein
VEIIRAQRSAAPTKARRLREELARAEAEAARYVAAIGNGGGKPQTLVDALAVAEARREALRRELAEMESPAELQALSSDARLEQRLAARAAHWRKALSAEPILARQALRALLAGPITFVPERDGYRLRGATKIGALWSEEAIFGRVKMASPRGFVRDISAFAARIEVPLEAWQRAA